MFKSFKFRGIPRAIVWHCCAWIVCWARCLDLYFADRLYSAMLFPRKQLWIVECWARDTVESWFPRIEVDEEVPF